jgi:hypothetical protein
MLDYVAKDLNNKEMSPFHQQMLKDCKALVDMSRRDMGQYYGQWDRNDQVYRGEIKPDEQDKKASERKEPTKMVVPMSYSQVQTFVAFCIQLYNQKENFFELTPMNEDSHKPAKIGEGFLSRDLNKSNWDGKLYQFLLDIARFGTGVIKTCWVHDKKRTVERVTLPPKTFLGISFGQGKTEEKVSMKTKFLGNKIVNISPYRFYPDTRLPISRFKEGEFCASEDEYSWTQLKNMQKNGEISGLEHVKDVPMTDKMLQERGPSRWASMRAVKESTNVAGTGQSKGVYLLTEVQRWIVPNEYEVDGKPLGEEDYPVLYNIQYVNDTRIVKCEPMNYDHDEFTYDCAEFNPDMHRFMNPGLSDSIDMLQSVISWFINSRITSVRKVIDNKLIVDPEGVEMKDLADRNPIIRLKTNAGSRGIDRWIKQLDVHDVTTNHIKDAEFLRELVEITTGINENIMGQFHGGRRSATEARNVTSAAAARLKVIATIIFYAAIEPMGRKMLSNLRQGLDEETMVKVMGLTDAIEGAQFMKAAKGDLNGEYDFQIFDGTTPSEKSVIAQTIEQYLLALMRSPEAALALQIDPRAMFMEALELRGVRNPRRFTLKSPPPGMVQPPGAPPTAGGGQPPGASASAVPPPGGQDAGLSALIASGAQAGV